MGDRIRDPALAGVGVTAGPRQSRRIGDNPPMTSSSLARACVPIFSLGRLALSGLALTCAAAIASPSSRPVRFDGGDFRVVDIDLTHDWLELHWKAADGHALANIEALQQWGAADGRTLQFAANAGIYDRQFRPLGLYIEEGQTLRPLNTAPGNGRQGNFSIQPNGVFYVDRTGRAGVLTTQAWREQPIAARIATQSGPMLVVDGAINANFDEASDSLKWRSGVCARTSREVSFAVSEAPVTFHAFARLFRDQLGCRDALYLDGTLSRIYTAGEGFAGAPAMMVKPYAGIFAVFGDDTPDR
jgi:uncharacterized protein YigE (DUF2233 family)